MNKDLNLGLGSASLISLCYINDSPASVIVRAVNNLFYALKIFLSCTFYANIHKAAYVL